MPIVLMRSLIICGLLLFRMRIEEQHERIAQRT